MKLIVILFLLLFSNASFADDCYETALTQAKINRCANQKYKEAKNTLEELLVRLNSVLSEEQKVILKKSQDAWADVTKHDCEIEELYIGRGSASSMAVANCYQNHNYQRVKMLASFLCHPMVACEESEEYLNDL